MSSYLHKPQWVYGSYTIAVKKSFLEEFTQFTVTAGSNTLYDSFGLWSTGCTLVASVLIDHSGSALAPYPLIMQPT